MGKYWALLRYVQADWILACAGMTRRPLCGGNATLHRTRLGMMRAVIASKAKQSSTAVESVHICFVAMLLAMTISSHVRIQGIV